MTGFWYLGSPYAKYPHGISMAYVAACEAAGLLIRAGIPVFSPIAHGHPIASINFMDHRDHSIWLPANQPIIDAARGLVILLLKGWNHSIGLQVEVDEFKRAGKPIVTMVPGEIPKSLLELAAS